MSKKIIFFTLLFINFISYSQDLERIPVDPRIKVGKLSNGFSYYLVKNTLTPGYADVQYIQKSGTVSGEKHEEGMLTLISELGLKNTRNFTDSKVIKYLNSKNLMMNEDVKINVDKEKLVYKLENLPVAGNGKIEDSLLLMIFNWSCFITFDELNVEREKKLSTNILLRNDNLETRLERTYVNKILGRDVDLETVIDSTNNYDSRDIREYYYKWFRPDLQAIVISGDIDIASVETQITSLFQAVPRPLEGLDRKYKVANDSEELYIISTKDIEQKTSRFAMNFRMDALSEDLSQTAVPYVMDYMEVMVEYVIRDRMLVYSEKAKFPIISIDANYANLFGLETENALTLSIETKPQDIEKGINLLSEIAESLRKHGLSRIEFERARDYYFSKIYYDYYRRNGLENEIYLERCLENYMGHSSLGSFEMKTEYAEKLRSEVYFSHLNTFLSSYLHPIGKDCIITYSSPQSLDFDVSEQRIDSLLRAVDGREYNMVNIKDVGYVNLSEEGKLLSEGEGPIPDSKILRFSNGAKVIIKKSDSKAERVEFMAVAKGGLSYYDGDVEKMQKIINKIAPIGGHLSESSQNLKRLSIEEGLNVSMDIQGDKRILKGESSSLDLETLFKLVHLNFTSRQEDVPSFEKFRQISYVDGIDEQFMNKLDYSVVNQFIQDLYSDVEDFIFFVIGDYNEETLEELASKYIGSIQPNKLNMSENYFTAFWVDERILIPMENPKYIYSLDVEMDLPYYVENMVLADFAEYIFKKEVVTNMSIEKGLLAEIEVALETFPEEVLSVNIGFVTKDYSEKNLNSFREILESINITDKKISDFKEYAKRNFLSREKQGGDFWQDIIIDRYIYDEDSYSGYLENLESFNLEKGASFIRKIYHENTSRAKIIMPAQKD